MPTSMRSDEPRSRQIVAQLFVDVIQNGDRHDGLPCSFAVASAIRVLFNRARPDCSMRRLLTQHPAVIRALFRFLMKPRTAGERRQLSMIPTPVPEDCICARNNYDNNTFLRDLHDHHPTVSSILGPPCTSALQELLYVITTFLSLAVDEGMFIQGSSENKPFKRTQGRQTWPQDQRDVFPYGVVASTTSLCAWITYAPLKPESTIFYLICVLITRTLGPAHYGLFSVLIPLGLVPSLVSALAMWKAHDRGRCSELERTNLVRTIILHVGGAPLKSLYFMGNRHLCTIMRDNMDCLSTLADLCLDVYHTLTTAHRSHPRLRTLENEGHRITFLEWSTRLCLISNRAAPFSDLLPATTMPRLVAQSSADPIVQLSTWVLFFASKSPVCANPGCDGTRFSTGRRLSKCQGCAQVLYCSRSCQRAGWRHAQTPHRAVCAIIGACMPKLSNSLLHHMREDLQVTPEAAELAVRHLEANYIKWQGESEYSTSYNYMS